MARRAAIAKLILRCLGLALESLIYESALFAFVERVSAALRSAWSARTTKNSASWPLRCVPSPTARSCSQQLIRPLAFWFGLPVSVVVLRLCPAQKHNRHSHETKQDAGQNTEFEEPAFAEVTADRVKRRFLFHRIIMVVVETARGVTTRVRFLPLILTSLGSKSGTPFYLNR